MTGDFYDCFTASEVFRKGRAAKPQEISWVGALQNCDNLMVVSIWYSIGISG